MILDMSSEFIVEKERRKGRKERQSVCERDRDRKRENMTSCRIC
jgi:hypothetical protein